MKAEATPLVGVVVHILALAKRDWQLQTTPNNQPQRSLRFAHASITGLIELSIEHHAGGCQPDWSEVTARYIDPYLPPVTPPTINVRWQVNRFGCSSA